MLDDDLAPKALCAVERLGVCIAATVPTFLFEVICCWIRSGVIDNLPVPPLVVAVEYPFHSAARPVALGVFKRPALGVIMRFELNGALQVGTIIPHATTPIGADMGRVPMGRVRGITSRVGLEIPV